MKALTQGLVPDPIPYDPMFQDAPECPECGGDMEVDYHIKKPKCESFKAHCMCGKIVQWENFDEPDYE